SVGSATQTSLTISMSASGASSYDVYRSNTSGGTYSLVASNVSSPFVNSGLAPGTPYYFKAVAKNAYGSSPQSSYASGTTLSASGGGVGSSFTNPIVVSGTSASGIIPSGGDLYFKYTASTTGSYTFTLATSFDSYLELYNSSQTLLASNDDGNGSGQPKIDYHLTAGQVYYFKAFGYNHNTSYYGNCTLNIGAPSSGGGGGVTPTTITEDFSDGNIILNNFSSNGWVWDTDRYVAGYSSGDNTAKEFSFTVNVPTAATTKTLSLKSKIASAMGSVTNPSVKVYVNGSLKYTNSTNDNVFKSANITLGTGLQTVRVVASHSANTAVILEYHVDDIVINWS
ncbi:MAG TPA: fibronectin type III domain-containing protein, partial [Chitinophagaceae bacterium]|nr:fibronectin type III domain-containing protein [Chitinophagaceae bacterium]